MQYLTQGFLFQPAVLIKKANVSIRANNWLLFCITRFICTLFLSIFSYQLFRSSQLFYFLSLKEQCQMLYFKSKYQLVGQSSLALEMLPVYILLDGAKSKVCSMLSFALWITNSKAVLDTLVKFKYHKLNKPMSLKSTSHQSFASITSILAHINKFVAYAEVLH